MLEEFVHLDKGDVIVQNGANSAVGQVKSRNLVHDQHYGVASLHHFNAGLILNKLLPAAACHPAG